MRGRARRWEGGGGESREIISAPAVGGTGVVTVGKSPSHGAGYLPHPTSCFDRFCCCCIVDTILAVFFCCVVDTAAVTVFCSRRRRFFTAPCLEVDATAVLRVDAVLHTAHVTKCIFNSSGDTSSCAHDGGMSGDKYPSCMCVFILC